MKKDSYRGGSTTLDSRDKDWFSKDSTKQPTGMSARMKNILAGKKFLKSSEKPHTDGSKGAGVRAIFSEAAQKGRRP